MTSILEVEGLHKEYKSFCLKNISFKLNRGSINGFIGNNGAGKTTTIKCILGLITKKSGSIKINGKTIDENEKLYKDQIGIIFDEGYFYDNLTLSAMKNIIAPAFSKWDEDCFNKYIGVFKLDTQKKISELSKGMRMKFSLALALSHNAELLIFDEPTSGLDPKSREQLINIMQELVKTKQICVFFSTHITSDLEKSADNIIFIDQGQIILNENKDKLINSYFIVKGNTLLTEEIKVLLINFKKTEDGFIGLTNKKHDFNKFGESMKFKKPTIEDIMLSYTGS